MKFLKWFFSVLGVAGLGVAGYFFFRSWVDVRSLMSAVNVNHAGFPSPWNQIAYTAGLAAVGGLLLGLGLGLPGRTRGAIRKEALASSDRQRERELASAQVNAPQDAR